MLKRRTRLLILLLLAVVAAIITVDGVMKFQLNQKVAYYLKFFEKNKDKIDDMYDPLNIKQIPYSTIEKLYEKSLDSDKEIDWSSYAYVNYVTDFDYLCNTVIQFKKLHEAGSKADLVAIIGRNLLSKADEHHDTKSLLTKLREISNKVVIKPVDDIIKPSDHTPWNKSLTKLSVFNLTEYERVIYFDNDAVIHGVMDELFFLPPYIKFAAPVTYWFIQPEELKAAKQVMKKAYKSTNLEPIEKKLIERVKNSRRIYNHLPNLPQRLYSSSMSFIINMKAFHKSGPKLEFASHLMVIKPDKTIVDLLAETIIPKNLNRKEKYDMDLINEELYNFEELIYYQFKLFKKIQTLFVPSVLVLPFTKYGLLTGSIKDKRQKELLKSGILGYDKEVIDTVSKAKFIHFSDYPLSKPWYYSSADEIQCNEDGEDCQYWKDLYSEYLISSEVCKV